MIVSSHQNFENKLHKEVGTKFNFSKAYHWEFDG